MPAEIRAFFNAYCAAFNTLDGAAVARLFAIPSGIASDLGYIHWPTYEAVRDNMTALCTRYRDNGYGSASFEPAAFIPQGERFAVADIRWRIERSGQEAPWEFNTTYNLIRTAEGWRVLLCTAYSEQRLNQ